MENAIGIARARKISRRRAARTRSASQCGVSKKGLLLSVPPPLVEPGTLPAITLTLTQP